MAWETTNVRFVLGKEEVEPGIFLETWPVSGLAGLGSRHYLTETRPRIFLAEFNLYFTTLSSTKHPSPPKLRLYDYILQCILALPSICNDYFEKLGCQWFILSHSLNYVSLESKDYDMSDCLLFYSVLLSL